ncbi:MAG: polysaccharide pyruvyl transferase family protein [Nodosilinea sp.]
MRVGILTYHHTTNYGATLQTYALYKIIQQHGFDVEVIDYRHPAAVNYYRQKIFFPIESKSRKILTENLIKFSLPGLLKYFRMGHFLNTEVKLSAIKIFEKDKLDEFVQVDKSGQYDAIVCGSDQIWCTDSIRGFDSAYFLDLGETKCTFKKISYAASCGPTVDWGKHFGTIQNLLSDFDAISVRDSNSYDLAVVATEKLVSLVLDPTFLIDFNEFIDAQSKVPEPYLLLYLEGRLNADQQKFIESIAAAKELKILSVGEPVGIGENCMDASPADWINYFSKASYIVTNLFHGTIFSIKFNQQFTTLYRPSKSNKTPDLLKRLGLSQRLLSDFSSDPLGRQLLPIDYDSVNATVDAELEHSRNFLLTALTVEKV